MQAILRRWSRRTDRRLGDHLPLPRGQAERGKILDARIEIAKIHAKAAVDERAASRQSRLEAGIAVDKATSDAVIERAKAEGDALLTARQGRADARATVRKAYVDGSIARRKAQLDADLAEGAAEATADRTSAAQFNTALIDLSKGSIERSRASAEFVQKAATAIFALYTGALAVAFSVTDRPLPARGVLPSVFLGLAIILSTGYLAYLRKNQDTPGPEDFEGRAEAELARSRAFLTWVSTAVLQGASWLRTSVVALAVGVVVLPAAFVVPPRVFPVQAIRECKAGEEASALRIRCAPAWPTPPAPAAGASAEKLYADQLAEVNRARKDVGLSPDLNEGLLILIVLVLGSAAVFALPKIHQRSTRTRTKTGTATEHRPIKSTQDQQGDTENDHHAPPH